MTRSVSWIALLSALLLPGLGAAASQARLEVCHVPGGDPSRAYAIGIAAAALEAHLEHGDTLFGVGLAPDCSGGLRIAIDPALAPMTPSIAGLRGGPPRPVGVLVGPDGRRDELVEDELDLRPTSPAELDGFLAAYRGTILRDDVSLIMNEAGELEERPGGGWYLIRIDPEASALADLPGQLAAAGFEGRFAFSSESLARTVAALLREADRTLTPNLVLEPHAILEHPCDPGAPLVSGPARRARTRAAPATSWTSPRSGT